LFALKGSDQYVLLGIFASIVIMRAGRTLFREFGANATSREVSLALITCQRAAIKTGDDHFLRFTVADGRVVEYRLMRDAGGVDELVDGPRAISEDVTVTVSHPVMRFNFEGAAGAAYQIQVTGLNQSWRVDVIPITGAVRVTATS
jgi:hypothetical protein